MGVTTINIKPLIKLLLAIKARLKDLKINQMNSALIEALKKYIVTFMMIQLEEYNKIGEEIQQDRFLLKKTFHSQGTSISNNIRPTFSTSLHII